MEKWIKKMEEIRELYGKIRRGSLLESLMRVQDSPIVVCEFDMITGKFISMSESSFICWGYTPDEMVGKSYGDFCLKEDIQKSDEQVEQNLNTGKYVTNFTNRYYHKNGKIIFNTWAVSKPDLNTCLCICITKKEKN